MSWHTLWYLWVDYGWSSDKGNGPEAIQQTILYAVAAVIFIPVVHRWAKRELSKVHEKLDHAHALIGHIIEHSPDIPEYHKEETP